MPPGRWVGGSWGHENFLWWKPPNWWPDTHGFMKGTHLTQQIGIIYPGHPQIPDISCATTVTIEYTTIKFLWITSLKSRTSRCLNFQWPSSFCRYLLLPSQHHEMTRSWLLYICFLSENLDSKLAVRWTESEHFGAQKKSTSTAIHPEFNWVYPEG